MSEELFRRLSIKKIGWTYFFSFLFNLLPLLFVWLIQGGCSGDACMGYLIAFVSAIIWSILYLIYFLLLFLKVYNDALLKKIVIFSPSVIFLIIGLILIGNSNSSMSILGILVLPNLAINFLYTRILADKKKPITNG